MIQWHTFPKLTLTGVCQGQLYGYLRTMSGVAVLVFSLVACGPGDEDENPALTGTTMSTGRTGPDDVPYITLRNKTGASKPANSFGDKRSKMRAGYCQMSRTVLTPLQSIAEQAPFYIPDDIVRIESIRELPDGELWQNLQQSANGARPVLYTHGFYISFNRGCKRASLFQKSVGLTGRFLLFSWPSDGAILNYTRDESDLYWSVMYLKDTIATMIKRFGAGGIDLVAHSLGTRGVFLALVDMADAHADERPLINQVVLLAPDIDAEIFGQYLPRIRPLVRHFTVYVSRNDRPLALSRQVHGYRRLGEAGKHLEGLDGIDIIDISELPVRYPSGHVYHLYHKLVVSDLARLLNEGKTASQRANLKQVTENHWRLQP